MDPNIKILLLTIFTTIRAETSCDLQTNKDFSFKQPLVLREIAGGHGYEFDEPDSGDSLLFMSGENVTLACPGSGFHDYKGDTSLKVSCVKRTMFSLFYFKTTKNSFENFECNRLPVSTLKRIGKCAGDKSAFGIGFEVDETFVKTIDVCFDESTHSALYAKHKILPNVAGSQKMFDRVSFKEDKLFPKFSVNEAYKHRNQKKLFAKLLPTTPIDERFNDRRYLVRGHLAPKTDFIFGSQQAATFHYANAGPQWNKFNSGNWNKLEMAVRQLAIRKLRKLTIYTGTYGTYEMDGTKMYLARDASGELTMPVPLVFWKVVYDENNDEAVAFIGLNDPDGDPADNAAMRMCPDLCSKISWATFKQNPEIGLMYCCTVQEFSKTITVLPSFPKHVRLLDGE